MPCSHPWCAAAPQHRRSRQLLATARRATAAAAAAAVVMCAAAHGLPALLSAGRHPHHAPMHLPCSNRRPFSARTVRPSACRPRSCASSAALSAGQPVALPSARVAQQDDGQAMVACCFSPQELLPCLFTPPAVVRGTRAAVRACVWWASPATCAVGSLLHAPGAVCCVCCCCPGMRHLLRTAQASSDNFSKRRNACSCVTHAPITHPSRCLTRAPLTDRQLRRAVACLSLPVGWLPTAWRSSPASGSRAGQCRATDTRVGCAEPVWVSRVEPTD
jgi:hypothetical protein